MEILIVDDSKAMRMLVKRAIRQAGFGDHDVLEAADGNEALELIKRSPPGVVLCDWNMPEMSGIELLTALSSEGIKLPFGFVTSEGTDEIRSTATEAGAAFLITKPFTPESVESALRGVLG